MADTWPDEEEQLDQDVDGPSPDPQLPLGSSLEDDVATTPVPTMPVAPTRRSGPFRIYLPDDPDLTDAMRLEIELRMTAGYWLHKALEAENRVELPDEIRSRKVRWKIILQESLVVFFLILLSALMAWGNFVAWMNIAVLGIMLIAVIVGLYMYKLWLITYVVCTQSKTGISRQRVRWMFINEIKPELSTKDIIISEPYRNRLFSTLDVNWWRVRLDTAAQGESTAVQNIRFMPDGDLFVETIEQFKLALR